MVAWTFAGAAAWIRVVHVRFSSKAWALTVAACVVTGATVTRLYRPQVDRS
jgi:hypothetical protein